MAEYIRAVVATIETELMARTPELLVARGVEAFTEFRRADTGVLKNPPMCWVTPLSNAIDEEGQGLTQSARVAVVIGLAGADPDQLVEDGMQYVAAVTDAIEAVPDWGANIRHVHPGQQDYAARFRAAQGFAIFPVVTLTVEYTEPPVEVSA